MKYRYQFPLGVNTALLQNLPCVYRVGIAPAHDRTLDAISANPAAVSFLTGKRYDRWWELGAEFFDSC